LHHFPKFKCLTPFFSTQRYTQFFSAPQSQRGMRSVSWEDRSCWPTVLQVNRRKKTRILV